jgi:hypothetical protein
MGSVEHAIGQQASSRNFDERVEDERKAKFQNPFRSVSETAVRRESQEVFEIRRKCSDDNS